MRTLDLVALALSVCITGTSAQASSTPTPTTAVAAAESCLGEPFNKWLNIPYPGGEFSKYLASSTQVYNELKYALPTDQCSFIENLPQSARSDYYRYETNVYTWWKTKSSAFSEWSSTCTGTLDASGDPNRERLVPQITPFLEPTAQARLNSFSLTPLTCATTTFTVVSTGGVPGPQKTMAGGAAVAAAAAAYVLIN